MEQRTLTRKRLFDVLTVDPTLGKAYWHTPPARHPRLKGQEAGSAAAGTGGKTYWLIQVDGVKYRRGRLLWFAQRGRWPEPCLDHIDGNSLNDRYDNLREATITENNQNHKSRARRIDLPMGVRILAGSGRFQARIGFHGEQIHLGAYDTPEAAAAVYQQKRKELFGEFA